MAFIIKNFPVESTGFHFGETVHTGLNLFAQQIMEMKEGRELWECLL